MYTGQGLGFCGRGHPTNADARSTRGYDNIPPDIRLLLLEFETGHFASRCDLS